MQKIKYLIIALLCAVAQADYSVSNEAELSGAIEDNANITLTQDITIGSAITIGNGQTVTINLGGFTLNRGCTSRGSQTIGVFSGGTLYLSNGTVTGGWGGGGGGMFNEGTMHLTNVTISGNTADDRGGGLSNNGTLTMTGCTVKNNTSRDNVDPAGGGGIFNYNGKTATLTNCTITDNKASTYGGGGICNYGTMTLNNCSLSGNNANTKGGGIFCSTTSTLSINGCTITGNVAGSYGDGIYIDNSTLKMQGLCTVTGNTDSNVYLYGSGTKITVTGAFTDGSSIGVGVTDYGRKLTSGFSTYNSGHDPSEFFSMDNYMYDICEKDGEAYPGITYWDHSWEGGDTDGHVVYTQKVCTDYQEVGGRAELTDHWYFASYSDTYSDRIQVTGDTKLILKDGVTLTCKKGIQIHENSTLTIYAQTGGTGAIKCTGGGGSSSNGHAAIGGNNDETGGHLVIHGGTIEAEPNHNDAAGIGGGDGDSGGQNRNFGMQSITIWDGGVTAKGSSSGAGIGGGKDNSTLPSITIYGGTVNATGGTYSAGIGGGQHISNGVIKIYGGNITATGGNNRWDDKGSGGAGIGGGMSGEMNNDIYIYGGTITANGGEDGAGIGAGGTSSGSAAQNNSLYIYGGTIRAIGGECAAGIGAGITGKGGPVYIYDGNVEITPGDLGAGIGGGGCYGYTTEAGKGGKVTISGGTVKLTFTNTRNFGRASYIGHGCYYNSAPSVGNLTLGNVKVTLNDAKKAKDDRVSTCQSDISSKSDVLVIEPCDHEDITYKSKNDTHHTVSCSYCSYSADEEHTMVDNKCTICGYGNGVSTLTFYEADGDSYNIETPHTTNNKENFSLPSCSNVPAGKAFIGWMKSGSTPSGVDVGDEETLYSAGQQITVTSDMNGDKYYARYAATVWPGGGNGTENDPFIISETSHWNALVNRVKNNGVDFSGYYLKLGNDVSVTEMVGTSSNRFRGTFDGGGYTLTVNYDTNEQYAAPFRFVGNATIKNLHVSGTISTSAKYASGLIGGSNGSNANVTNCRSSVAISSTVNGDGTHGGFVANIISGTVNIKGCIFDGSMAGNSTTNCGGFVGYISGTAANLTDCLFMPTSLGLSSGCYTFVRRAERSSISNCFYTSALGTAQGTQAYTVTNGMADDITIDYTKATANYGDDDITAYDYGLLYDGTLYSGDGKSVTFDVSAIAANKGVTAVTATKGTISGSHGSYTLTMVADNSSINATLVDKTNSDVILEDATENTPALEYNDGRTANVIITGRTLYKDGDWNTLCLPTDVTADQIEVAEHPLHGATIMELDTEGWYDSENNRYTEIAEGRHQTGFESDGTLYLYFKTANSITAGKPYLVRWGTPESPTGGTIVNPDFYNSTINSENLEPVRSADGKVQFIGNYDPVTLTGGDKSVLYLGSGNQLYYPSETRTMNSFRAYFHVDLSNDNGGQANVRAFVLNFGGNGETTGIIDVRRNREDVRSDGWYDLQGRKLATKPTTKGIYIYNGKKRVIK